jgi:hypothetical protein
MSDTGQSSSDSQGTIILVVFQGFDNVILSTNAIHRGAGQFLRFILDYLSRQCRSPGGKISRKFFFQKNLAKFSSMFYLKMFAPIREGPASITNTFVENY